MITKSINLEKISNELKDRNILSLVLGIIIGKLIDKKYYNEYEETYRKVFKDKDIPVLYNMNFDHSLILIKCILPYDADVSGDYDKKVIVN